MPYTLEEAPPELLPPSDGETEATSNRWTLNFGPQHPATHTTLRLVLELDGERVVKCTPHIGYLHSGFEKLGEHLNYNQYVTIVDRMDYSAPIYNELAWFDAIERLLGIDLRHSEADMDEDPVPGLHGLIGEHHDVDAASDPTDVDGREVGTLRKHLNDLSWNCQAHALLLGRMRPFGVRRRLLQPLL